MANTTINNATINTVSVNVAPVEVKEEKNMITLAVSVEELKGYKVDMLRLVAKAEGIKGYSKMKKAELVEALVPYCDPSKKVEIVERTEVEAIMDTMASAPVETTVVNEEKEVTEMKKELTPVTVDTVRALAVLAKSYDPFTAYIDNGRQKDSADRANAKIRASWDAICESCGIDLWIGNTDWSNASLENAEKAIASWLGIELPKVSVVVEAKVVQKKEEQTMVVKEKKDVTVVVDDKWEKLMKAVSLKAMLQTVPHDKNNKPVINIGKDGKVVLLNYSLFYRPTERTDVKDLMVVGKKLWGVVSKVIEEVYGKNYTTSKNIQDTIDKMVESNLIHKVVENRTYVTVSSTGLPEEVKNTFNDLYLSKDIKVEKDSKNDGRVKVIAVTDKGRNAINTLYPNFSYRASSKELTNMYNLSR